MIVLSHKFILKVKWTAIFSFFISGCVLVRNPGAVLALRRVGQSQKQAEKFVSRQENLFAKLLCDLADGNLHEGMNEKEVIRMYGDPILVKYFPGDGPVYKRFLYRKPLEYFATKKVYLYFDSACNILRWEVRDDGLK